MHCCEQLKVSEFAPHCRAMPQHSDTSPADACSVIATKAAVPLVYVPLEGVSSKWCGLDFSKRSMSQHCRLSDPWKSVALDCHRH